ncbi:MAG: exo-alpha-sialidase, partial [Bdellovibrionaceae bacterium]|nr:exo-alpha-sialidase [Pseudobdellovibrionaceae bacterium]
MKYAKTLLLSPLVGFFVLLGCNKDASVSNVTSSPSQAPTSATANTCSSPTTTAIWKGERSIATTVAVRGAWSDIKIIPGTTSPATAYLDNGCFCVRYSYWDGTTWKTEIIAAANAASSTFIRLAFLSSGIPLVVWSNSTTTLQMAIRNTASTSAEGSWTITSLDTAGTAIRAIELKVNPADQVAILYARNTGGTANLILCTSNCSSGSSYSSPSTTLGTVGTNPDSLGLGWCSSGSSYYPVIAVSGATNSSFAICRQSTLANCLTGIASWAGGALQTLTGSGANRVTVQLAMDDSSVDAPVRAVLNNGSGIAYYQSSFAGGGCSAGTIGAIASGGTISGTAAASGNAFLELQRVTGGNYHLIANEATTSVRYYNTTTGSFTAWNAQGTVATATLAAAGSTRGGLAVDASLSQAYTTYARTSAGGPFPGNLTFGWVENTTVASNGASAEYYETPLTLDGQIQMTASQVPNISISATSLGKPATAFVDYSSGSATAGILKFAIRDGNSADSSWIVRTIPVVAQPQAVSIIFDNSNLPWVGFYDQQSLRFLLATNTQTDGSGAWSVYYFPFRTAMSAAVAPAYHSVALAMDKTSSSTKPIMIVGVANHATLSNTGVWSAKLDPATGNWTGMTQIVSTNLANSISNVSADYDSSGNVVVGYYNRNASNRIEYSQSLDGGTTWSTPNAVTSLTSAGMGAKIKLNPSNSRPAITFFDRANNRVYYAYCSTSITSCTSLANWSYSFVENLTAGVSTLAATSDGLLSTGLTFTSTGVPYITYPIGSGNSGVLAINNNSSGSFPLSTTLLAGKNAN